jgi:hypothetical protein
MTSDPDNPIWEQVPVRPPDATHRLIASVYVALAPLPGDDPRHKYAFYVNLDRQGMPLKPRGNGNGLPRPPVRCTIDLRVGDQMLSMREWRVITGIKAQGSYWLNDEHGGLPSNGVPSVLPAGPLCEESAGYPCPGRE